jgi:hypothetical protein
MSTASQPEPGWGSRYGFLSVPDAGGAPTSASPIASMAIQERIHRYAWAFDERRRDVLANCFTADAVWAGNTAGTAPVAPLHGRNAIADWLSGFWTRQVDQRRHLLLSVVVSHEDETSAHALASLALTAARAGRIAIVLTSFYNFDLVREEEIWRIAGLFEGFDVPF